MDIDIASLRSLSAAEKLQVVTQLWDDIAASGEPVVLPPAVLEEATRRSEELAADPSLAIDDAELWRRVDGFHVA
ncbi:MAG: addiction module protein [Planctomycetota bacterium]